MIVICNYEQDEHKDFYVAGAVGLVENSSSIIPFLKYYDKRKYESNSTYSFSTVDFQDDVYIVTPYFLLDENVELKRYTLLPPAHYKAVHLDVFA